MQPTALELSTLLPWVTYGTPSGITYPLGDAMPSPFYITVDRGPKVPTYNGCQCDRMTIRGSQGNPLDFLIDVVGIDETLGAAASFPSLTLDTTTSPFIFSDCVLTVGGTAYKAREIEFTIDNAIDKERFFNSQTLVAAIAMDRHVTLNTSLPYGDASAAYASGAGGVAVTAVFTGAGTQVLTLSCPKVAFPRKSPSYTAGRAEEMLPMQGICYKSGASLEVLISVHQ